MTFRTLSRRTLPRRFVTLQVAVLDSDLPPLSAGGSQLTSYPPFGLVRRSRPRLPPRGEPEFFVAGAGQERCMDRSDVLDRERPGRVGSQGERLVEGSDSPSAARAVSSVTGRPSRSTASLRAIRRGWMVRPPSKLELATASARSRNRASGSRLARPGWSALRARTRRSTSAKSAATEAGTLRFHVTSHSDLLYWRMLANLQYRELRCAVALRRALGREPSHRCDQRSWHSRCRNPALNQPTLSCSSPNVATSPS